MLLRISNEDTAYVFQDTNQQEEIRFQVKHRLERS